MESFTYFTNTQLAPLKKFNKTVCTKFVFYIEVFFSNPLNFNNCILYPSLPFMLLFKSSQSVFVCQFFEKYSKISKFQDYSQISITIITTSLVSFFIPHGQLLITKSIFLYFSSNNGKLLSFCLHIQSIFK